MAGPWGTIIRRCFDLRAALKMGMHIGMADVTAVEFRVLTIIESEMPQQGNPNG